MLQVRVIGTVKESTFTYGYDIYPWIRYLFMDTTLSMDTTLIHGYDTIRGYDAPRRFGPRSANDNWSSSRDFALLVVRPLQLTNSINATSTLTCHYPVGHYNLGRLGNRTVVTLSPFR